MFGKHFLKPDNLLHEVGLKTGATVVDFGCGNGSFSLAAGHLVQDSGTVWAIDIREEALSHLAADARIQHLQNIKTRQCDLDTSAECGIPDLSCDLVIVSKILAQLKNPDHLVRSSYRALKTGGQVLVVEWKPGRLPFGPPPEQRVDVEKAKNLFTKQAFKFVGQKESDPFHYALVFQK